jgi:hypothetical protein
MINIIGSVLCIFFTVIPIYKFYTLKNNINKCWSKIKCTPIGQLLHPLFGPKEISMSQNAAICDNGKFNTMFESKIKKYNDNMSLLQNIILNIKGDIIEFRKNIEIIKNDTLNEFKKVGTQFSNVFIKIGNLFVILINAIKRILDIFKYVLQIGTSVYYSLMSIWNGPIFSLSRTFAGA